MKILRIICVTVVGVLGGALIGAVLLGVSTYTAKGLDYFGQPLSVWTDAAALAGAIYGSIPGLVLGLTVAATEYRWHSAALLGSGIGLITVFPSLVVFFVTPASVRETRDLCYLLGPIPFGALLGLIMATVKQGLRRWRRRTAELGA